jgi:hypothetical protein
LLVKASFLLPPLPSSQFSPFEAPNSTPFPLLPFFVCIGQEDKHHGQMGKKQGEEGEGGDWPHQKWKKLYENEGDERNPEIIKRK